MTIVLAVLKFIGILLLVLLAVLLLLLLFVFFFPVSYRIWGHYQEKPMIRVKIHWLFSLFSFHMQYADDEIQKYLRIFGIRKNLQKETAEEDFDETSEELPEEASAPAGTQAEPDVQQTEPLEELPEASEKITSDIKEIPEIIKDSSEPKKRIGIFQRIRSIIRRIREKLHDIKNRLLQLKNAFTKIKGILQDPECGMAFPHLRDELFLLLKRIHPRKIKLNASFSTGSPDTTGGAIGVLAMFPAVYKNHWNIYPDFESEQFYIRGDFDICGRIYLFQITGMLLRIVFDKNCRKLYHKMTE